MNDPFDGLMKPWQNAQRPMMQVIRWGNFPDYGQTLVEHNNALPYVLGYVRCELASDPSIDWLLLADCVQVHDQGEPLSGGDEHAGNKTSDKELQEYVAFAEHIAGVNAQYRYQLMKAFLLQFVRKPQWHARLTDQDQVLLAGLIENHQPEAAIFDMVERLDYLASAVYGHAQGIRNDTESMIDHVLNNQVPKLDALAKEHPPLQQVWTPKLRTSLLMLGTE